MSAFRRDRTCLPTVLHSTLDATKRYDKPKRPNVPWTKEAQEAFMAAVPERLKLAKLLLHFSGQRGGDCVRMKWSHFDGAGLFVSPENAGGETLQDANYHLCPKPPLDVLNAAPRASSSWSKSTVVPTPAPTC